MNTIFKGLRSLDYVLAVLVTGFGVYTMIQNIHAAYAHGLAHPQSTTTAAMLPFFLLVTVPILWRRRDILSVCVVTAVALTLHVILFGWETRCQVVVPLAFALAYAVARFADGKREHWLSLAVILVMQVLTVARDSSISTIMAALPILVLGEALLYGIGRLVRAIVNRKQPAAAVAVA